MRGRIVRSAVALVTTTVTAVALCAPPASSAPAASDVSNLAEAPLGDAGASDYPLFTYYRPEFGNWLYVLRDQVNRGDAFNPPVYAHFIPEYEQVTPPQPLTYTKLDGPEWLEVDSNTGQIRITNDISAYLRMTNRLTTPEQVTSLSVKVTYPDGHDWAQHLTVVLFDNEESYEAYNNPATVEEPRFARRPIPLTPGETLTLTRKDISWKDPQAQCGEKPGEELVRCKERETPGFWPDGIWDADLVVEPQPQEENPGNPLLDPQYVNVEVVNDANGQFQELRIHAEKKLEELTNQGYAGGALPIRFRWKAHDGESFTTFDDSTMEEAWDTVPLYVFFGNLSDKDNYVPRAVAPITTATGQEGSAALPEFDSAGIAGDLEQPVNPTFTVVGKDAEWVSVENGRIVARPTAPEHVGKHKVQMRVDFQDGSHSRFGVDVTVTPLAAQYEPRWDDATLERGTTTMRVPLAGTLPGEDATTSVAADTDGFAATANADGSITVTAPADAKVGTTATLTATTKYSDTTEGKPDTVDTDTFTVTVVAPPGDNVADLGDAPYPTQRVARDEEREVAAPAGENIAFAPVTEADSGAPGYTGPTPTWAQVDADGAITLRPDAKVPSGLVRVPVRAEDGSGNVRIIEVPVTVGANRSEVAYPTRTEAQVGEPVTIAPLEGVREGLEFAVVGGEGSVDKQGTISYTPKLSQAGERTLRVRVTDHSGATRDIEVPVTVRTVSDRTAPTWADASAPQGEPIEVANSGDSVEGAVVEASLIDATSWSASANGDSVTVHPGAGAKAGDRATLRITATYGDGSSDTQDVTVRVTDARAYPEGTVVAPAGETTRSEAPGGFGDSATFALAEGSPYGNWVAIDPATGAATLTPAARKRDPEFVAAGSYDIPVVATLPGGERVQLTLPVAVTSLAANLHPKWRDVAGAAGAQLLSANVGDALPEGTVVAATGPGGWDVALTDGEGTVTLRPPAGAKVGDATPVRVALTYPDGSTQDAAFTAKVARGGQSTTATPQTTRATATTQAAATTQATTTTQASATTVTAEPTATAQPAESAQTAKPVRPTATTPAVPTTATTEASSTTTTTVTSHTTTSVPTTAPTTTPPRDGVQGKPGSSSSGSTGSGVGGSSTSMLLALAASPLLLLVPIALAQQVQVPGLTPALDELDAQLRALPPEVTGALDAALEGSGFHLGGAAAAGGVVLTSIVALSIAIAAGQAQGQGGSSAPQ
ncbi:hypothetical protein FPH17_07790 [Corynebacterium godavarianum]|uniref:Long Rib domain-containing protein n=1 Tax=Corynebacterium godavarianum TaxID=2054421 RepID=A0ABY3E138_9CORY|nr:Rib/alpha-like domain-containing protein [Corynebacterium godavarianum]MBL7285186.1 hypothetical protein [Corynebacterium godavarianum]TSJ73298.1 hypothetical protein FPH17_07790 [Corynebacterium godavarianum]